MRSAPHNAVLCRAGPYGLVAGCAILWSLSGAAVPAQARAPDVAGVVGPAECAECHKHETESWKISHHAKTFSRLPRRKEASQISRAMGLRRIKAGGLCLTCHFTSKVVRGREKPIAGISCESCHGAGKKWLKRHSEYSGKKKQTETKAEARKRWAESEAAGMIRPRRLYALTKNCFSCHVVPEERLVNRGGHPAGSPFELVSWSQGEVRHNTWHNGAKTNRPADPRRRRMMYVIGTAVELETALRAVAKATTDGPYAVTMATRAALAKLRMKGIARATKIRELIETVNAANAARLTLNNAKAINAAADRVAKATKAFAGKHDGSRLGAVDRLIPHAKKFRGTARNPNKR